MRYDAMMNQELFADAPARTLPDGLLLRGARDADVEAIAQGNALYIGDAIYGDYARELMSGDCPLGALSDFTVVEDKATGRIVSSLGLLSQVWSYEGVPFRVGQPEMAWTNPDYRRRGLLRAQMETAHQKSAGRGDLVQIMDGIPNLYRRFGYELALSKGGGRVGYAAQAQGAAEAYRVREATEADASFLAETYRFSTIRSLVTRVQNEASWSWETRYGASGRSGVNLKVSILETPDGRPAGFFAHEPYLNDPQLRMFFFELTPGVPWLTATPIVLRYLVETGKEYAGRDGGTFREYALKLGTEHPAYDAVPSLLPRAFRPFAWYIRVADLPAFLRHIAPVLERRIVAGIGDYSGELRITFYRSGLRLAFEGGRLIEVGTTGPGGVAGFPDLTFLQLLMGYRSLAELEYAFADCWVATDEAQLVLTTLFPKRLSHVGAIV